MGNKIKLLVLILGTGMLVLRGQAPIGQLTIKVKAPKEYQGLWDSILIENKDTVIRLGRNTSGTLVTLHQGQYTVILKSRINGQLKKRVDLKKTAVIEINAMTYYKPYRDTSSMLLQMKDGDTCFMNYTLGVNHLKALEYFMVVKEGTKYNMVIKNEINEWRSVPLFEYEFSEFMQYGKHKGPVETSDAEGLGVYYWSLNRQVLRRNCGICLYGFLFRKLLVRQK